MEDDATVTFVEYAVPVILRQFRQWHRTYIRLIRLRRLSTTRGQLTVLTGSLVKQKVIFPQRQLPFAILTPITLKVGYVQP